MVVITPRRLSGARVMRIVRAVKAHAAHYEHANQRKHPLKDQTRLVVATDPNLESRRPRNTATAPKSNVREEAQEFASISGAAIRLTTTLLMH